MAHVKTMEAAKIMEDLDTTETNPVIVVEEDTAHKTMGNWRGGHGGQVNNNLTHYYWTHLMCFHPVKDCRNPEDGHQKDVVWCSNMFGSEINFT